MDHVATLAVGTSDSQQSACVLWEISQGLRRRLQEAARLADRDHYSRIVLESGFRVTRKAPENVNRALRMHNCIRVNPKAFADDEPMLTYRHRLIVGCGGYVQWTCSQADGEPVSTWVLTLDEVLQASAH